MSDKPKPNEFKCPSCGHVSAFNLMSVMPQKQRMSFVIKPGENGMLGAETVGGTLDQMGKLIRALGREHGQRMSVMVSGVSYDNGAIQFDLLVAEAKGSAEKKRKKGAHRTGSGSEVSG